MRYKTIQQMMTGVAVPLGGLRTEKSCGIGEFTDLLPFARWAHECGMRLIQLLPINDTGEERSPYSALSAFALHPVYITLSALPLSPPLQKKVDQFSQQHRQDAMIAWLDVVRFKRSILREHYSSHFAQISKEKPFLAWIEQNQWVKPYAVFSLLKEQEEMKSWQEWSRYQNPTPARIDAIWSKNWEEVLFFSWVQWIAEGQLLQVSQQLSAMGVMLKGDIPILLSEDSADVWHLRKFFDLNNRAGAPPDMFCYAGQNWRFPAYRWSVIERDNYSWWRARLRQAAKFYSAYRIDHVLGFFRIWQVPETEQTGVLGRFVPAVPLRRSDLLAAGFSPERLDHLVDPLFPAERVAALFEGLGRDGRPWLKQIEGGWKIDRERFSSETALFNSDEPQPVKDALIQLYWDRVLLRFEESGSDYHPHWYWYDSNTFHLLTAEEQGALRTLIEANYQLQEPLWTEHGKKILTMMLEESDMLVCAEDLGVVPPCVPRTLEEMGILGLKIERWTRDWEAPGQPWVAMEHYPRLSVCSPGTHDTSSLRGYWEETTWPRAQYASEIGLSSVPDYLTEEVAEKIIKRNLEANSLLVIIPLQDWLALRYERRAFSPEEERINVPGSLDRSNWRWRMYQPIEEVARDEELKKKIGSLIEERTFRPLN